TIMEQFNPSLRNFIAMGKNYEKALAGVTYAAKGYFDALVKMGELASESQGSKELATRQKEPVSGRTARGDRENRHIACICVEVQLLFRCDVLFQMAEVHRQIQNQLEEMLKSFHNELLTQLEQKVELDSRYLSAALKKYQAEQRSKGDALDKCQAELKKLRKKSQGSKNPQKYSDKELQTHRYAGISRPYRLIRLSLNPHFPGATRQKEPVSGRTARGDRENRHIACICVEVQLLFRCDVLFQMAEVHRQIQNQLEEMLKSFHNELLTQLEQKVELDSRYLSAALKKYQAEQRSKGDALDKCQAELKKLRKKSQGSKNPQKYSDKELQYIDAIGNKQGELESYVSDGYKTALTEERRRFCFLVEKQCAVAKNSAAYHSKGKELLAQKLPLWQQACADPNKIPDRAVQLMQQVASSNGSILPSALSASKSNLVISDPIPGAKPLPVPPELAPFVGRLSAQDNAPVMNGVSGPDSEDYNPWADRKAAPPKSTPPPQSQGKLSDSYSNTLPVRKSVAPKSSYAATENKTLPRSSSMAAGLERNGRMRVKAIFSHAAGDNSTLLSFKEGDLITLLVPEARDGWHYGESEKTKMRGWFPFSYTRVLDSDGGDRLHMSLQQGKSSSTGNLLDKEDLAIPPPDYGTSSRAFPAQTAGAFKQRPYSVAVPAFAQGLDDYGARAVSRNPFASVQLKPTVTNDRSAPLLS
ncbi:Brain-specific angiogenesis inhibitor 1-associated protein 2, partial [Camelus dromedarius]